MDDQPTPTEIARNNLHAAIEAEGRAIMDLIAAMSDPDGDTIEERRHVLRCKKATAECIIRWSIEEAKVML